MRTRASWTRRPPRTSCARRAALGEPITAAHEAFHVGAAKLYILLDLLADLDLDDEAMTILNQARDAANQMAEELSANSASTLTDHQDTRNPTATLPIIPETGRPTDPRPLPA